MTVGFEKLSTCNYYEIKKLPDGSVHLKAGKGNEAKTIRLKPQVAKDLTMWLVYNIGINIDLRDACPTKSTCKPRHASKSPYEPRKLPQ